MDTNHSSVRVGLFGIGLDTYWDQFEGLLEKLQGYQQQVHQLLAREGVEVVDTGLVDNVPKASEAAAVFKRETDRKYKGPRIGNTKGQFW